MRVYRVRVRYFIQHPAGTSDLVLEAISSKVGKIDVLYQDESALLFDSRCPTAKIGSLPFAKNAFVVLTSVSRGGIGSGIERLGRRLNEIKLPNYPRVSTFRTMIHIDGELVSANSRSKSLLEKAIASRTKARLAPRGNCQEYWVIGRLDMRELLLCVRLAKPKRPRKAKGAISHELSAMLVYASRPGSSDVFLDPFAGSGSFVLARLEFPAQKILYSDRSLQEFRSSFPREITTNKRVRFFSEDALILPSIPDGAVDVIVTDPPWGEHEDLKMPYSDFANAMAKSFDRVLHPGHGNFVVLCSRRNSQVTSHSLESAAFKIKSSHSILVNGHPATVLIGGRILTLN